MAKPGTTLGRRQGGAVDPGRHRAVPRVPAHPRRPTAELRAANSTAEAARMVSRGARAPVRPRSRRESPASCTASRSWPPTSPTTPATRPASCWSPSEGVPAPHRPRPHRVWSSTSAPTSRAASSRSCRSSRRGASTCRTCCRDRPRTVASATTASSIYADGHVADELLADAMRVAARQAGQGEVPRLATRRRASTPTPPASTPTPAGAKPTTGSNPSAPRSADPPNPNRVFPSHPARSSVSLPPGVARNTPMWFC